MNSHEPNIVFITSGHSPFSARLFSKELSSLKKKYKNLTIIAPYNERKSLVDDIEIIGIKKYRSRYNRWSTLYSLYKSAAQLHPDVVHCHEPDSLLVAYLLKKQFPNMKAIYDCHEFHPQSFTETFPFSIRNVAEKLVSSIENFLASRVDAVITVNSKLVKRFDKVNKSVVLLPNYSRFEVFQSYRSGRDIFLSDESKLIYVGNIGVDRGVIRMLSVLRSVNTFHKCRLVLIGKFSSSDQYRQFTNQVKELGLTERVGYKGFLSHEETVLNLERADIGLCLLAGKERYGWSEPIKYFEYSAAGLPVIMSDIPSHRFLIEKNENGLLVPPDSIENTVNAIRYLIEHKDQSRAMSQNGIRAFQTEYNWETIEPRLLGLYGQLA